MGEPDDVGAERAASGTHRVRLPGFLREEDDDVGLGDVVKRATSMVGIKPCGGCAQRAQQLNGWMVFSARKRS